MQAPVDLDRTRRRLLGARDARAAIVAEAALGMAAAGARTLVFLAIGVPGPDKDAAPLDRLFATARDGLLAAFPHARVTAEGRDALGSWAAAVCAEAPEDVKRRCVALEEQLPAGRLLDVDVFDADLRQVGRRAIGLPPRRCLLCDEPAADCIRVQRHGTAELAAAVRGLIARVLRPSTIAHALVAGARAELELTPKPGLVDRFDNGSHPDLSFDLMARSIDLLPAYFEDLIRIAGLKPCSTTANAATATCGAGLQPCSARELSSRDLDACIEAGRRAEARMAEEIGSNAHRGYIFLSGLVLLAAAVGGSASPAQWRQRIGSLAIRVFERQRGVDPRTHGARTRRALNVAGVHGEAIAGLPSVFDRGLPAFSRGLATLASPQAAGHYAMAALMQSVEDTTTLHRAGRGGLARLRRDGAEIQGLIEAGRDHLPALAALNAEYRAAGLTMGGVADCLALTFALHKILEPDRAR